MGLTRTRKLSLASDLPVCTATVVHTFDDGWSVRVPITVGDIHREGVLMSNCLALADADIAEYGFDWSAEELIGDGYDAYRSLRDPDNLPRMTWRCDEDATGAIVSELLGPHNSEPAEDHHRRVRQWARALGKPCWLYTDSAHLHKSFGAEPAASPQLSPS